MSIRGAIPDLDFGSNLHSFLHTVTQSGRNSVGNTEGYGNPRLTQNLPRPLRPLSIRPLRSFHAGGTTVAPPALRVPTAYGILERVGKPIRNPPRDAMLSHAAKQAGGYGWPRVSHAKYIVVAPIANETNEILVATIASPVASYIYARRCFGSPNGNCSVCARLRVPASGLRVGRD